MPICDRGSETETTDHFFLRCPFFVINRQKLLNGLFKIDLSVRNLKEELLLDIILYGSAKYRDTANKYILFHTISFIKIPNALKDHCLTYFYIIIIIIFFPREFNLKDFLLPITFFTADYFINSTFWVRFC